MSKIPHLFSQLLQPSKTVSTALTGISGELRNWQIVDQFPSGIVVVGDIYDDRGKKWSDGKAVLTCFVIAVRDYEDFYVIETDYRQYLLFKNKEAHEHRRAFDVGARVL